MQTQTTTNQGHQNNNDYALEQIDEAIAATKQAAHAVTDSQAKEHLEYALALVTECWIAEDGQQARPAQEIISNVQSALDIFDALEAYATNQRRKEGK